MTDSEKLDLILGRMQGVETGVLELGKQMEAKMGSMETKIGSMETKIGSIETRIGSIETKMDSIETKVDSLRSTVEKNYGLLENFYAEQKEYNTYFSERLKVIFGELEMHRSQIASNTEVLRKIG